MESGLGSVTYPEATPRLVQRVSQALRSEHPDEYVEAIRYALAGQLRSQR